MPNVSVSQEPRIPGDPSKASGDRLRMPGVQALGIGRFQSGLNFSKKASLVNPLLPSSRPHTISCSADLLVFAQRSKRPNKSKPSGRHDVFTHYPEGSNCEICKLTKNTRAP